MSDPASVTPGPSVVSVVIPTFNRARDLERAIASVRAQSYPHWEILVVDNHSTDDTVAAIDRFADARIRRFDIHNQGVIAASRNLGIAHASGEFVAFLDSDDWWTPDKLRVSVDYLSRGADVVYHDMFWATMPGRRWYRARARSRTLAAPVFTDLLMGGNALINSSVVMRRHLLSELNGLVEDPGLVASEDYDLWLRTAEKTEAFVRIPSVLGYYWAGSGNYWARSSKGPDPRRVLASLEHFEARWSSAFAAAGRVPAWLHYNRGQALVSAGNVTGAATAFRQVGWRSGSLGLVLKTQIARLRLVKVALTSGRSVSR